MPALSEVPFSMDDMDGIMPPDIPPEAVKVAKLVFADVVKHADDVVTAFLMDPTDPDCNGAEMSVDQIEVMRMGVVAATTVLMEQLGDRGILRGPKWAAYLAELLAKDAEQ